MISRLKNKWVAGSLLSVLPIVAGCRHSAVIASNPGGEQQSAAVSQMRLLDQVNSAVWEGAWTNLLNDVEQSFRPSLSRLQAVEVELVIANDGSASDRLTLTVLDDAANVLSEVSKAVTTKGCDHVSFFLPGDGIQVEAGHLYRLRLTGGTTFGWKYIVGGYDRGAASFNGQPLLRDSRATFLFRTFGTP